MNGSRDGGGGEGKGEGGGERMGEKIVVGRSSHAWGAHTGAWVGNQGCQVVLVTEKFQTLVLKI